MTDLWWHTRFKTSLESKSKAGLMIEVKPSGKTAAANLRALPQTEVAGDGERPRRSRHTVVSNDLYTLQGYKTWMHNLRHTREGK